MHHPEYAWMFFNWWKIGWWLANSSCTIESSIDPTSLEKIVKSSLVFDHFPRIEDERKDEPNQGNIVRFIKLVSIAITLTSIFALRKVISL